MIYTQTKNNFRSTYFRPQRDLWLVSAKRIKKTQFKILVFNTNSTGGTWFIQDCSYVSSVIIRRNKIVFTDKFENI